MSILKSITRHLVLTTTICAGSLGLLSAPAAAAPPPGFTPGWSWNLSRDMIIDLANGFGSNPVGDWTFMEAQPGDLCGATALPMSGMPGSCWGMANSSAACWYDLASGPVHSAIVGLSPVTTFAPQPAPYVPVVEGVPGMHPGFGTLGVVRWTNPHAHPIKVRVLGRFTHIDPWGSGIADGVDWSVSHNCASPLVSGFIQSTNMSPANDTGVFSFALTVNPSDALDFVVDRRGNYNYDSTELDVLIVAQ